MSPHIAMQFLDHRILGYILWRKNKKNKTNQPNNKKNSNKQTKKPPQNPKNKSQTSCLPEQARKEFYFYALKFLCLSSYLLFSFKRETREDWKKNQKRGLIRVQLLHLIWGRWKFRTFIMY